MLLVDSPHQTESVTRRIAKDPESIFTDGLLDAGCAQLTDFSFGFIDVVDEDVEVKLLEPLGSGNRGGACCGEYWNASLRPSGSVSTTHVSFSASTVPPSRPE